MTYTFLNNKYTKWYFAIIASAKSNANGYLEKHHIIPKSLGGNNTRENIVKLTAKQHFICHLLLTKMTEGSKKSKMLSAAWAMVSLHSKHHNNSRHKVNSKQFAKLRETALTDPNRIKNLQKRNKLEGNPFYKKKHTVEAKKKMSIAKKGKVGTFYGKLHSEETKLKISFAKKGQIVSEELKQKNSAGQSKRYESATARQKTSEAMKKLYNDPVYRAKRGWPERGEK
jgi:hypothetical protein